MLRLRTFGSVGLEDDAGRPVEQVLAQPKRLALLTFLAVARPPGPKRRDQLLVLFWPDLDEARARDALNQALRFLRQALGAEAIVSRGTEDVGVDPERLWCDAVGFRDALDTGRSDEALELYRGDFLQGFFIEEGGGFEEWMERERVVLREAAAVGSRRLADQHAAEGALTLAISWGRRALDLVPDDERALRRLLRLHERAGDRVGGIRLYEEFTRRLQHEYSCDPSAETTALAQLLRSGKPLAPEPGQPRPAAAKPDAAIFSDRYVIERKLGAGGMATVFLARDLKHDREVALKVLRPEIAEGLARERFVREIRIAGRLQHPNIVPLFDSGEANGQLYYVMPHVQGETLRERLTREGRLEVSEVVHILREVAGALAYAHERGVVHRDIKPENLLLIDRRAVLTDFGIARAAQVARTPTETFDPALTQPGTGIGTPGYMAPEQAAGDPEVDHRADLYAVGVMAYEMLTGRTPFGGGTPQELLAAQLTRDPVQVSDLRPEVPGGVGALVMRCLERPAAQRPQSARQFLEQLEQSQAFVRSRHDGIVPNSERLRTRSRALPGHWKRFGVFTLLTLAGIVLATLVYRELLRARTSGDTPEVFSRIAVLYFDDDTPDGRLRWLARGLTEDLIDALAATRGLSITSRNGVRPYEGQAIAPQAIGRSLNVGLLIDGTVGAVGADSVSLSVRLVDARSGVQLEQEVLTRRQREPNLLRRDLTALVETSLRRRIGAHVRLRQERVAAGGDVAWEYVRRARELREEARGLPPVPATVRLHLADSLLAIAERSGDWVEPTVERAALALVRAATPVADSLPLPKGIDRGGPPALRDGIAHATRALERAPINPRALAYRGEAWLRLWQLSQQNPGDSMLGAARADLSRASQLDPNLARAWYVLTEVYQALGEVGEAGLAARKALAADVYATNAPMVLGQLLYRAFVDSDRSAADSLCAAGKLHFPANPNFRECEFTILGWLGATRQTVRTADSLLRMLDSAPALRPYRTPRHFLYTALLARAGLRDSARTLLRQILAETRARGLAGFAVYEAYTELLLGDRSRSLQVLKGLVEADPSQRAGLAVHPWFRPLYSDQEFRALVKASQ